MFEHGVRRWLRLGLVALGLLGCRGPVRQAEALYAAQEPLGAFRVARAALKEPGELQDEERRRLRNVLIHSARQLLSQPDPDTRVLAFETFEGLEPGSEERVRAAQRLFRVMVKTSADLGELDTALAAMEPEMGEESDVRSNLRQAAENARGTAGGLWAARTVVTRWPDDAERWVDLGVAHASMGQFEEARGALRSAEEKLHTACMELPSRMAGYDKVRRLSAYAQHEVKRCDGFPALLTRHWAWARREVPARNVATRQVNGSHAPTAPCPAANEGKTQDLLTAPSAVMLSPAPLAWWVDGTAVSGAISALNAGERVVVWKNAQGTCQRQELVVADGTAIVVRTQHPDLKAL